MTDDEEEPSSEVMTIARAIAEKGFGRSWDDFLPINAHDTDHGDLIEYARAAIAGLRNGNVNAMTEQETDDRSAIIHWAQSAISKDNLFFIFTHGTKIAECWNRPTADVLVKALRLLDKTEEC